MIKRIIPSTGEELPAIGLGTWQTFDVAAGGNTGSLEEVMQVMVKAGATLIDSSPMYGNAETMVGDLTGGKSWGNGLFYATKVWTTGKQEGIRQMEDSFRKMKRETMDLVQIHNLVDWKTQLETLRSWKAEGKIRYTGITHYTDSMHEELEKVLSRESIDFVQFNYSPFSRHAEKRLLQAAADHGVATLINRPFGEGKHFRLVRDKALPSWVSEYGIETWSQFFLQYILSHPAVTCIIPATGNPAHAFENFNINPVNPLSEQARERMRTYISHL